MSRYDIVIVGAGHGGSACAIALRQTGYSGTIALVGEELGSPFKRPPLSKECLSGDESFDRMLIRPRAFWAERSIEMIAGTCVTAVDPAAHCVSASERRVIANGQLVSATDGVPRRSTCKGHDLVGVDAVRNRTDVDRLAGELPTIERVVVISSGYIGLEAAALLVPELT